jgi:hypothetical protein
MTESKSALTIPESSWGRSQAFRTIFCNFFQYRVGHGEIALMLARITSEPTPAGLPAVEQEAEILMTWPQMKSLVLTMQAVLQMIESEVGHIPLAGTQVDQESALDSIRTHVRNLKFPQRTPPQSGVPPS